MYRRFFLVIGVLAITITAQAAVVAVNDPTGTGRSTFGGNDSIDWAVLGVNFTTVSNPFTIDSASGITTTVSEAVGTSFQRRDLGSGWGGNFTDNSSLLWTNTDAGSSGPVKLLFDQDVFGIGFQINPNYSETATTLEAFNASNVSLGLFALTTNNRSTPSGSFIGVRSTAGEGIRSLTISQPTRQDFAINKVDLITGPTSTVPEPSAILLVGTGLVLASARLRRCYKP